MTHPELKALLTVFPDEGALDNARRVLSAMEAHNLEGDQITQDERGGVNIVWNSQFNVGHEANIECTNDGIVTAYTINHNTDEMKFWWVREFVKFQWFNTGVVTQGSWGEPGFDFPDPTELILTLEESMEYIRHFIWANHDV